MKQKLIVLTGPTTSGKTDLSLRLAKKFNCEIISADSRQVYRGMGIGTGKIPISPAIRRRRRADATSSIPSKDGISYKGISHHLIDVASPKRTFTVAQWKRQAETAIKKISKKGRLPMVVGGTGFYIEVLLYDLSLPTVRPSQKFRNKLKKLTTAHLYNWLERLDPERARDIDPQNRPRLIRALEIIQATGEKIPKVKRKLKYDALTLGIRLGNHQLRNNINRWIEQRADLIIKEIKKLRRQGISFERLINFGLTYRYFSWYLLGKLRLEEAVAQSKKADWDFARRQYGFFKRLPIKWIKNQREAEDKIRRFLR